jgi:hypothetical protein
MKKITAILLVLTALLILCACQENTNVSSDPVTSSDPMLSSKPNHSSQPSIPFFSKPSSDQHKPAESKPPASSIQLPENCDNGHTFLGDEHICAVCGVDYYSITLDLHISDDGKYYIVTGLGQCERKTVIVPETHNGLPVEVIKSLHEKHTVIGGAIYKEALITKVVLPNSIKSIDKMAFNDFISLESINVPDAITRIEEQTFGGCSSLESLTLPDGVTYIGKNAFAGCTKLKDLYIPESVTEFGIGAFTNCEALE